MTAPAYPPAPWTLRGEATIVAAPVRVAAMRRHRLPPGVAVVGAAGWTAGGVVLARYDETATLPYHELIVFSGLGRRGRTFAFVVSHIYVDSPASLEGGREIWGLPKELASFDWSRRAVVVEQDGRRLLAARLRFGRAAAPIPLLSPVFGEVAGATVRASGTGRLRATPALARLDIPRASPFAGLGLGGSRLAVSGDGLDVRFPAARPA